MLNVKLICLILMMMCALKAGHAQTVAAKAAPIKITSVGKFKPPQVKTFLGLHSQTAAVTIDEANQLVNLPLKITDDKGNLYTVSSYQFLYRKKSVIENEQTGKREIFFSAVADLFKVCPLPLVWRSNISGGIQKGEELYFFDILVKDKSGRTFFAPEVKIVVK